jgi:2-polyprenyl-3-methyl-5-hydroxy-6-metoxy-1,4-benzoquinol methylase
MGVKPDGSEYIDYKTLLANSSEKEHHQQAENYFANITDPEYLIAKPFYTYQGASSLLGNFAALLHGLDLYPGSDVLDFAAGTGWTSRIFAQMGCNVTSTDVSKSALLIAQRMLDTYPLIGSFGHIKFLNSEHMSTLQKESFDRITIMDGFHHIVDQFQLLEDFYRLLRPGGCVVMSEPGRAHSLTPQAQSEMRQFGVLERDLLVEEIEVMAKSVGYSESSYAVFNPIPTFFPIHHFSSIFEEHSKTVSKLTENYMQNHNLVRLRKPGEEIIDSRRGIGLSAALSISDLGDSFRISILNSGTSVWLPSGTLVGNVNLGLSGVEETGLIRSLGERVLPISDKIIKPGQSTSIEVSKRDLGILGPTIELDLVAEKVVWFGQLTGSVKRISLS